MPLSDMSIMAKYEDRPFFFHDAIFREAQHMFELRQHSTSEFISPCSSNGSSEGGTSDPPRLDFDISPPDVRQETVCMMDLRYHWPTTPGDDDQGSDLFMREARDEVLYLQQRDENLLSEPIHKKEAARVRLSYEGEITKALTEEPGRSMSVNELYDWFERNSTMMANRGRKTWQNSIRQALSTKRQFKKLERRRKGPHKWTLVQDQDNTPIARQKRRPKQVAWEIPDE